MARRIVASRTLGGWRVWTRCLVAALFLVIGVDAAGRRIGPDIENFDPPYSRSDPLVAKTLEAYDAEDDAEAERLSRLLLARSSSRRSEGALAQVEARFLLARVLDSQHRLTEAETQYRQGLMILQPLVAGNAGRGQRGAAVRSKAREWARYFELLLRDNLEGQGRFREADLLATIIPPAPGAASRAATDAPKVERAVGWLPPIAVMPCPGGKPDIREPSDAERQQRQEWDSAAVARSVAHDPAGAEQIIRKTLALDSVTYGPTHCEAAVDHRRLAEMLLDQDRFAEAEEEARRALTIFDRLNARHREAIYALETLAEAVGKREGAEAAEPYLRRALAASEQQRQGADNRETLFVRLDLGANLYAQGLLGEAEKVYRRALVSAQASYIDSQTLALDVQEFAGFLAERQGRIADAVNDYRAVCASRAELTARSRRGAMASLMTTLDQSESGTCALRRALALRRWVEAGGGSAEADRPDALRAEAFEAAQAALPSPSAEALARAGARIAAATSGAGGLAERYEAAIRRRDEAGYAPRTTWQDRMFEAPIPAEQQEERQRLDQEIAEIASRLAREAPLYWDIRTPQPLGIAALQARRGPDKVLLRKDEALILFMVPPGARHGLVFAVSKDRTGWDMIGMTGAELKRDVGTLRGSIDNLAYGVAPELREEGPGFAPFDRELAYRLYQALLGSPSIQDVIRDRKTLIFVPTGPLTTLPPGLLVTQPPRGAAGADDEAEMMRGTDWLLRRKAIAVLPSVASLRTLRQLAPRGRRSASEALLAFTDPDFSGTGTNDAPPPAARGRLRGYRSYFRDGKPFIEALRALPRLPHTRDEGMALAAALGVSRTAVLSGPDASKAELMKRNADGRLSRARIVEFATHGLVAGAGDGLAEPALVLSAGPRPEDWLLTASDAATLRLNADWVLLSACNTASPDLQEAEGLSGLVRAFFYSGASALLVSHWTIGDETSAQMVPMTIRLHRAGKGLSRADALRRASLAVLDNRHRDETHPVYWAPFTLVGDPK